MSSTAVRDRTSVRAGSHPLPRPRRRRWGRLLVGVLVLVLVAAAGWLVGFSSVLAARHVQVVGARVLTADEVRTAAAVPLGTPLLRQDLDGIAARVDSLAVVESAAVSRSWPHTIVVTVSERTPLLAVRQPAGFWLVDRSGTPYLSVPAVPKGVLPADVDLTNASLLSQVGVVAAALPPPLERKVSRLQALTPDGIRLRLKDGDIVTWGSSAESNVKAEVLSALLERRAQHYDVSAPHSPALR